MLTVPLAARCACWLNAWLSGRVSADDAIEGLAAGPSSTAFALVPGEAPLSPALLLGALRGLGAKRASAALPVPGQPTGLGGPAAFNLAAVDAGGAVVLHGPGVGLVPERVGGAVLWRREPADPPVFLPDVALAARELRATLLAVTDDLVALDVAAWNPDVADALMNLRADRPLDAPMAFASPEASRLAHDALRAAEIVRIGLRDDGGALTADEMTRRRAALQPLLFAAQTALVAGVSTLDGR